MLPYGYIRQILIKNAVKIPLSINFTKLIFEYIQIKFLYSKDRHHISVHSKLFLVVCYIAMPIIW